MDHCTFPCMPLLRLPVLAGADLPCPPRHAQRCPFRLVGHRHALVPLIAGADAVPAHEKLEVGALDPDRRGGARYIPVVALKSF